MTTPNSPMTAYSVCRLVMTAPDATIITFENVRISKEACACRSRMNATSRFSVLTRHEGRSEQRSRYSHQQETRPKTHNDVEKQESVRDAPREFPMPIQNKTKQQISPRATQRRLQVSQRKPTYLCKYHSWSLHCVIIRHASSRKVTMMRKRPMEGKWGFKGWE